VGPGKGMGPVGSGLLLSEQQMFQKDLFLAQSQHVLEMDYNNDDYVDNLPRYWWDNFYGLFDSFSFGKSSKQNSNFIKKMKNRAIITPFSSNYDFLHESFKYSHIDDYNIIDAHLSRQEIDKKGQNPNQDSTLYGFYHQIPSNDKTVLLSTQSNSIPIQAHQQQPKQKNYPKYKLGKRII